MENEKELNTPETVPGASDVSAAEGKGNDASTVGLAELVNREWGTSFKDDAAALEGLRNNRISGKLGKYRPFIEKLEIALGGEKQALTFMEQNTNQDPASQAPQPAATPVAPSSDTFVSKTQYERDMWLASHNDVRDFMPILDALRTTNPGKSYDELMEMPAFKSIYDKAKEADDLKNSRQPLTSSSRVYTQTPNADYDKDFEETKKSKDPDRWARFMSKHKSFQLPKGADES